MQFILGIDQGGTKTAAAVMDETGKICGYETTEGAYFREDGMDTAMSRVDGVIQLVLKQAGLRCDQITYAAAGITGIDWPEDSQIVETLLKEILKLDRVQAYNDCVIAMFSGTQKRFGAALCAGTGINAVIVRPDGKQFVMGEYWGSELQGGSAISYRALRKVFDSDLGLLPKTALTKLFLDFTEMDNPLDLLKESMDNSETLSRDILKLVPQIVAVAESGDQVTMDLLDAYADEVCDCFIAGLRKMDMLAVECDIVLAGSVFKGENNRIVAGIIRRLSNDVPQANIVNAKYEPVVGACVMGFLQNASFTEQMSKQLETTAQYFNLIRPVK